MKEFADLLDHLYFTYSHLEKKRVLIDYFIQTPDPDRGYALAIIAGVLKFNHFKRGMIYDIIATEVDPTLFALSYDYVGDLSETIALIWPHPTLQSSALPPLHEIIENLLHLEKQQIKSYIRTLLDHANPKERWALVKLATGELRIGVSARFLKQVLADYGKKDIMEIEHLWHALGPPYISFFNWLEGKSEKPDVSNRVFFHPIMLSQPLVEEDLLKLNIQEFLVEWKYDGIRVQVISTPQGQALFSRSGDDISQSFSEILTSVDFFAVLDGELMVKKDGEISTFNDLQQRLNRKKPSKKLIEQSPAHIILYDALILDSNDLRTYPLIERRARLEKWWQNHSGPFFSLSPLLEIKDNETLKKVRADVHLYPAINIEGIMIKRKSGAYLPGRPANQWYKWKRNPFVVDAILMYAQRGQGKRSSFYSDYTFGLWKGETILPIGKAYFGFTDEELYLIDKWVRQHTLKKFGPVREVKKLLVFEIAFEGIQLSSRHKSGYALRFPRINKIRWDKPAVEADTIETLHHLYLEFNQISK